MNKNAIAVALLFTLFFSAIPINRIEAQGIPNPDTITIANQINAESCDPAWAYDTASGELIFNVLEPLLWFKDESVSEFVPMLAESWPGSDVAGRNIVPSPPDPAAPVGTVETWYFEIRPNVPWHNPVYGYLAPEDVEFTFERGMVMDYDGGPQWMILEPLLGIMTTREYDLTNDTIAEQVGHMIDDAVQSNATHVWFNLHQSYAAFQQILSQSWSCILDKQWVIDDGDDWPGFDVTGYIDWRDYKDPPYPGPLMDEVELDPYYNALMGTGPYILDYWDVNPNNGWWRLVKFNEYWRGWDEVTGHKHATIIIEKATSAWSSRRTQFISEDPAIQCDLTYVPRGNYNDLQGESGIRYMANLPTLVGNALFFNYNVNSSSSRVPTLGGVPKPDLFSDRHMRLAFSYAFNVTDFIQSYFKGGAFSIGNPIIQGIRYYNASKPYRNIDVSKVIHHLQLAWGGQAWNNGFTVIINCNTGNTIRLTIATMIASVINSIKPGSVEVVSIPWSTYLPEMYNRKLCAWMLGWLADFPDPHALVIPFMHTSRDFSGLQNIEYGLDPASMEWTNTRHGGYPSYTNYAGETITEINNTYVDGLIETGIQLPDSNPLRQELYEELMDIFYAECPILMTYQTKGRHYERDWVQGWYYNVIWPGNYYYELWKEDVSVVPRDLVMGGYLTSGSTVVHMPVTNLGKTWESYQVTAKIFIDWVHGPPTVTKTYMGWVGPGRTVDLIYTVYGTHVSVGYKLEVKRANWFLTTTGFPEYLESYTDNNVAVSVSSKFGDLGGGIPPWFFNFDNKVDGKDLALFLQCYRGTASPEVMYLGDLGGGVPPQFFQYDGIVDGKDLSLFLLCYKGQGPDT